MNLRKNFQPLLKQLLPHFCKQLFFAARYLNLRHAESLRGLGLGKSPEIAKLQKSAVIRFKTLHYLPQGKQIHYRLIRCFRWNVDLSLLIVSDKSG